MLLRQLNRNAVLCCSPELPSPATFCAPLCSSAFPGSCAESSHVELNNSRIMHTLGITRPALPVLTALLGSIQPNPGRCSTVTQRRVTEAERITALR